MKDGELRRVLKIFTLAEGLESWIFRDRFDRER